MRVLGVEPSQRQWPDKADTTVQPRETILAANLRNPLRHRVSSQNRLRRRLRLQRQVKKKPADSVTNQRAQFATQRVFCTRQFMTGGKVIVAYTQRQYREIRFLKKVRSRSSRQFSWRRH